MPWVWLPERVLILVADSGFAAIELLAWCQRLAEPLTMITRLRLDAALYEAAPIRVSGARGRPRLKGKRLPTLTKRRPKKRPAGSRHGSTGMAGSAA